jgi:hypothetical protein
VFEIMIFFEVVEHITCSLAMYVPLPSIAQIFVQRVLVQVQLLQAVTQAETARKRRYLVVI